MAFVKNLFGFMPCVMCASSPFDFKNATTRRACASVYLLPCAEILLEVLPLTYTHHPSPVLPLVAYLPVPSCTSICYRKGFLSSASCTLLLCKVGVHHHPFWMPDTLGTCLCKFGNMPRNYILLRLYLLFALLTVFTSTSYSDAMSLIFILRLI